MEKDACYQVSPPFWRSRLWEGGSDERQVLIMQTLNHQICYHKRASSYLLYTNGSKAKNADN